MLSIRVRRTSYEFLRLQSRCRERRKKPTARSDHRKERTQTGCFGVENFSSSPTECSSVFNSIAFYLLLKNCQGKLTRKPNNFSKEVVRSSAELLTVDGKGTTQNHQHIDYTLLLDLCKNFIILFSRCWGFSWKSPSNKKQDTVKCVLFRYKTYQLL